MLNKFIIFYVYIWGFINKSATYFTVESSINIIFSNDVKCISREGYYVEKILLCKISSFSSLGQWLLCMHVFLFIYINIFYIIRTILWERSMIKWKMFFCDMFHHLGHHLTKFIFILLWRHRHMKKCWKFQI